MRYVLGGIDRVRDGYAAVVRRLVRVAIIGVIVVVVVLAGSGAPVQPDAAELPARGGSGRLLRRHAAARGRLDQPHRGGGRAGRGHHPADPRRRGRAVGGRLRLHRRDRLVEPGLLRHPPEALRAAHRPVRKRRRHHRAAAAGAGRDPAARSSSRSTCRRSSASAAPAGSSTCSRRLQGQSPADLAATMRGMLVAANQQPELGRRLQHLRRRHAADLSRHRPRQGPGAGRQDRRHLQRAAVDPRRLLRQRLQPVRPHLAGQCPGRDAVPQIGRRHLSHLCAQRAGRHGADARARRRPSSCRVRRRSCATTASAPPSSTARPKPGYSSGQALAAMERHLRRDAAGGLWLRMDRHGAAGEGGAAARRRSCSALAMLFAYLFLVALYESWNIPIPVLLSVSVGVPGRHRGGRGSPGSASTSMPRSASSC